jgi:hypothetical protein
MQDGRFFIAGQLLRTGIIRLSRRAQDSVPE